MVPVTNDFQTERTLPTKPRPQALSSCDCQTSCLYSPRTTVRLLRTKDVYHVEEGLMKERRAWALRSLANILYLLEVALCKHVQVLLHHGIFAAWVWARKTP